jgi:putative transposase
MYFWPSRKSVRHGSYDYNQAGYYFVTICTKGREHYFWEIKEGEMILSDYGKMIHTFLEDIPKHFPDAEIDNFVVMPNHIHALIIILNISPYVGGADLRSLQDEAMSQDRTKMLLSKIIHGLKSSCTREIRKDYGDYEFAWQKSFYDVIIKNEEQLSRTRQYIWDNPKNWDTDTNNV